MGKKPKHEVQIYSAVYEALSADLHTSFAAVAQSKKVQKLCQQHGIRHLGGAMLGCLSSDGAKVWLRTTKPAKVEVKIQVRGEEKIFGPVMSSLESDLTAVVEIKSLPAGTSSFYSVFVDGEKLDIASKTQITTPSADHSGISKIAIGTCQHRWGLGHVDLAKTVLERNPLGMLMYGDVAVQDRRGDLGCIEPTTHSAIFTMPGVTSWLKRLFTLHGTITITFPMVQILGEFGTLKGERRFSVSLRKIRLEGCFLCLETATVPEGLKFQESRDTISFDLSKKDPTVSYRLIEAGGEQLFELELKRSELTPC